MSQKEQPKRPRPTPPKKARRPLTGDEWEEREHADWVADLERQKRLANPSVEALKLLEKTPKR